MKHCKLCLTSTNTYTSIMQFSFFRRIIKWCLFKRSPLKHKETFQDAERIIAIVWLKQPRPFSECPLSSVDGFLLPESKQGMPNVSVLIFPVSLSSLSIQRMIENSSMLYVLPVAGEVQCYCEDCAQAVVMAFRSFIKPSRWAISSVNSSVS